ncbi:Apolipoprotein N-acyltransferase [hydrothermal vent metagenome]|uniref:Apolipoprotein N-acyltransferase n=1 Tax=hydrothermal vent metagenome TaxID=652676 RepID=A0A1W1BWL0_9ZZZZ
MVNIFKTSGNITTFELIRGFFVSIFASMYLYLSWIGISYLWLNTLSALFALYLLLDSNRRVWAYSGLFIGLLWFWWISMSFRLYGFAWATPIGIILTAFTYALIFWLAAFISDQIERRYRIPSLAIKAIFLLIASYIHPFGFDWFKPELMFVESYIGVEKWHFAIVLSAIGLSLYRGKPTYLIFILLAYNPIDTNNISKQQMTTIDETELVTTYISIEEKQDLSNLIPTINLTKYKIDEAIRAEKKIIIFPESILPIFLNREQELLKVYRELSHYITIVIGALHWDESVPRNSAYIFQNREFKIADKVILVPFGESNPLPDWMSNLVNKIFYDGAIDYKASDKVSDYTIDGRRYRSAICYEACSEKLYDGKPKNMIVLSNNGWFTPSIEPTMQRLLLQYYSRKYGTTIFHSINGSPSYIIINGRVIVKKDNIGIFL